jgi:hypothetical protein
LMEHQTHRLPMVSNSSRISISRGTLVKAITDQEVNRTLDPILLKAMAKVHLTKNSFLILIISNKWTNLSSKDS